MKLRSFVRLAVAEFEAVPPPFRRGITGPVIQRKARRSPVAPGVVVLGMCVTAPVEAAWAPEDQLSTVVLFYGSFVSCAMRDPTFDIAAEVRETIRHEIRHHIEDRAGIPDLRREDDAAAECHRWRDGAPFRRGFHRGGEPAGPGLWRLEGMLFVEPERLPRSARAGVRALRIPLPGGGERKVPLPLPPDGDGTGLVVLPPAGPPGTDTIVLVVPE